MTAQLPFPSDNTSPADVRFRRFHEAHPEVFDGLVRLCRQWRARSGERWSVKGAFEVLRWETKMDRLPDASEAYKLNNNYHSRYARLIGKLPDLQDIFEQRELRS